MQSLLSCVAPCALRIQRTLIPVAALRGDSIPTRLGQSRADPAPAARDPVSSAQDGGDMAIASCFTSTGPQPRASPPRAKQPAAIIPTEQSRYASRVPYLEG
ncbi:hypothetical protein NDU88_004735 [Pleurodeles waltl]|uniref:Uncharacterized protein n=1 Tax=Pleurodeles waltl TaxID=8319 RepID=A0AAV7V1Y1_PLEWA|nr:hypothetical protein NDU88_004735 [Pleurodeles waltl]